MCMPPKTNLNKHWFTVLGMILVLWPIRVILGSSQLGALGDPGQAPPWNQIHAHFTVTIPVQKTNIHVCWLSRHHRPLISAIVTAIIHSHTSSPAKVTRLVTMGACVGLSTRTAQAAAPRHLMAQPRGAMSLCKPETPPHPAYSREKIHEPTLKMVKNLPKLPLIHMFLFTIKARKVIHRCLTLPFSLY